MYASLKSNNHCVPPLSDEVVFTISCRRLRFKRQCHYVNLIGSRADDLPVRLTQHSQI